MYLSQCYQIVIKWYSQQPQTRFLCGFQQQFSLFPLFAQVYISGAFIAYPLHILVIFAIFLIIILPVKKIVLKMYSHIFGIIYTYKPTETIYFDKISFCIFKNFINIVIKTITHHSNPKPKT